MPLVPKDNAEREKVRHDLASSMVVEAGAGTGKTSLLIDRLLSLVDEGKLDITSLAAITFTDKAAAEMRDRMRRALERRVLDKASPFNLKLVEALNDIDRAHISTIHAFATSIIREYPFEAGIDPNFQHIEADEERDILEQALRSFLSRADDERDKLISHFLILGGRFNQIRELLTILHAERELLPHLKPSTTSEKPAAWFGRLESQVRYLAENAREHCHSIDDPGRRQIEELAALMPDMKDFSDEKAWRWLLEVAGMKTTAGQQDNWDDADSSRSQKELIKELKEDALDVISSSKTETLERLIAWLRQVVSRTEEIKIEKGCLSFQDQLIFARKLLDHPNVLNHLRDRFKRLLIDEFQDTDPLQVEIALMLASVGDASGSVYNLPLELGKISIIGDPKQSIYRFRRADTRVYNRATRHVTEFGSKQQIAQNFRSAPGIIEFVNIFFGTVWKDESVDPVTYAPLISETNRPDPEPSPPVLIVKSAENETDSPANIRDARRVEARIIADSIQLAVIGEKWQVMRRNDMGGFKTIQVNYGDMAVLFPKMTDIDIYTDALSDAGIPFNIEGGKGFYGAQIVRDLYYCLAAIDNPAARLEVIGALRSRFFGVSDKTLIAWMRDSKGRLDYRENIPNLPNDLISALETLKALYRQRTELPPDRIIEQLLENTDIAPALLSDRYMAKDLKIIENVIDMARNYEESHRTGLRGFRRWFAGRLTADEKQETAPAASRVDYVRLMTVHSAKGLEFPVVILPNVNWTKFKKNKVIADRYEKKLELEIGSASNGFRTAGYDNALVEDMKAAQAESLRLLYVAMTRAQDHLILPCVLTEKPEDYTAWLSNLAAGSGEFENREFSEFRLVTSDNLTQTAAAKPKESMPEINADEVWKAKEDWLRDRAVRLNRALISLPSVTLPSSHIQGAIDETPTTAVDADAASIGAALHSYMALTEPVTTYDKSLAEFVASQEGIDMRELRPLVQRCLDSVPWMEAIKSPRIWREVPVIVKVENGILKGAVDLVWEDNGGNIHICDWKGGAFQSEKHEQQLRDYAKGIEVAVGRTVSSAILFFAATGKSVKIVINGVA